MYINLIKQATNIECRIHNHSIISKMQGIVYAYKSTDWGDVSVLKRMSASKMLHLKVPQELDFKYHV